LGFPQRGGLRPFLKRSPNIFPKGLGRGFPKKLVFLKGKRAQFLVGGFQFRGPLSCGLLF